MVICLHRGADLHMCMSQLMPMPLTVSCFSKIQTGFTFLAPAHPGSTGKRAVKRVCVCVCVNKTEEEYKQIRTAAENMKHCLTFSREIFYVTIVLCLNIR